MLAAFLMLGLASTAMAAGSTSTSTPPDSRFKDAESLVKAGDFASAIPLLQKVVANDPNNADALNYLGFSYRKLGDLEPASTYYEKALAVNGRHKGALEYQGELFLKLGKPELAEKNLRVLDKVCTFGCEEYDDLKAAIKAYMAKQSS